MNNKTFLFLSDAGFQPRGDCCIAAAIIGAGALSAGASAFGASSAANAQTNASNNSIAAQRQMFDIAKGQEQPFIDAGKSAIPNLTNFTDPTQAGSPLAALLKLITPGPDQTSTLQQTPGYQFTQNMGQKAVNNALAARGLAGPGGALSRGSADYATGLASNTWQNVVNALLGGYQAGSTSLQNLVNTGAGAAGTLTGAATQTGAQIGQNMVGIGNAQGGAATAIGNAVGGFGNSISSAALLQKLLGGGGGGSSGLYGNAADAGGYGVGTGGFNYLDAQA